jgi:ribosomal protein S18 acetylase RimI-like enzyme
MNHIQILDYLPEHQPYFENLNRAWIEKYFELEELDKYVLQQPEEAILKPGGAILMATFDGVIAGTVALKKLNEDEYELAKMAVDENYRRMGIAEKLCSATVQKSKHLGAKKLILYSQTILEPALALYRKLGFVQVALGQPTHKRSDVKMEMDFHQAYSFRAAHPKENSNNFI